MSAENKLNDTTGMKVSYKDTLNLPRTDFPIHANAAIEDPKMIDRWKKEHLYTKAFEKNKGATKYILHDGPPYANGHIHLGHAYNKILKDIITKSQRMMGKHVPVTPGWDCHGLPIEFKVNQENPGLPAEQLKEECRKYAASWIDIQREEFKQLGVVMDWDRPYLTMSSEYEADTVRAFGKFVKDGYIQRKNKTVPWCAHCQTVLASAEIEYQERKDPSLYVLFTLAPQDIARFFELPSDASVSFAVWTTTPWTLPLNRAVFLKPGASYDVLKVDGRYIIVGSALSDNVCKNIGQEKKVVATCQAEQFVGLFVAHPFIDGYTVPVLADHFVSLTDGTACVHSAPGCGPEDYEMGLRYGLEIYSPLSVDGRYTKGIVPTELENVKVTEALGWVITQLQAHGTLLFKSTIKHSYPHCWRCRQGLIFRATKQWFCDLGHAGLRDRALQIIDEIEFIPEGTHNRLKASVMGRLEWCLSRQRAWGVPIIAALCTDCEGMYTNSDMIELVAQKIEQEGMEYWDKVTLKDILPVNACCSLCGGKNLIKEVDILDVWFDSGVSHYAVLARNPDLQYPASIYCEGSDQHRGWFQSSLLTGVALTGKSFTKTISTHGFTVDEQGRKMSKSLGNVVAPAQMIAQLGTDGLRLWAASIDASSDAVVSELLLTNIKEVFRKIRNTCRFLVSNLYDFDYEKDAVPLKNLKAIDAYIVHELKLLSDAIRISYEKTDFTAVMHQFSDFCSVELSAFYLDIIKDRLYTDKANGYARRSAQTACWILLDTLTRLMAPIMSFTAEQLSDNYQKDKACSIHLQDFVSLQDAWYCDALDAFKDQSDEKSEELFIKYFYKKREQQWRSLRELRSVLLKSIEVLRQQGLVKHSLEAKVAVAMNIQQETAAMVKTLLHDIEQKGEKKEAFLKEYAIISACDICETDENEDVTDWSEEDADAHGYSFYADASLGFFVKASHADGVKCPRCWQWDISDHGQGLCTRCGVIVDKKD